MLIELLLKFEDFLLPKKKLKKSSFFLHKNLLFEKSKN
jgi:hypothetical protein